MAFTVAFILAALTACAQAHRYATGGAIPVAATSRGHLSYGHDTLPAQRGPFLGAGGYDGVGGFDQGFPGLVSGIADGYRSQIRGVLNNVGRHGGCGVTGNDCPIGFECVNNGRGLPYCEEINRLDRFGRNGRRGGFGSIGQGTARGRDTTDIFRYVPSVGRNITDIFRYVSSGGRDTTDNSDMCRQLAGTSRIYSDTCRQVEGAPKIKPIPICVVSWQEHQRYIPMCVVSRQRHHGYIPTCVVRWKGHQRYIPIRVVSWKGTPPIYFDTSVVSWHEHDTFRYVPLAGRGTIYSGMCRQVAGASTIYFDTCHQLTETQTLHCILTHVSSGGIIAIFRCVS
ncbi:hypothetical protein BaRGS_00015225 [Batillaria attramentaria]|uniref:Uncharacterized protein n=1 Tax=Batillaria attramentaria TaxID=370345 RepID=A0ABD0L1Z2_9CAEN